MTLLKECSWEHLQFICSTKIMLILNNSPKIFLLTFKIILWVKPTCFFFIFFIIAWVIRLCKLKEGSQQCCWSSLLLEGPCWMRRGNNQREMHSFRHQGCSYMRWYNLPTGNEFWLEEGDYYGMTRTVFPDRFLGWISRLNNRIPSHRCHQPCYQCGLE